MEQNEIVGTAFTATGPAQVKIRRHGGGWPKGKLRKARSEDGQIIKAPTMDPQLKKLLDATKEEELLSLFVQNQRANNRSAPEIIASWQVLKSTLTPDNIDLLAAEERLKLIVQANRAALSYSKEEIVSMVKMAVDRTRL